VNRLRRLIRDFLRRAGFGQKPAAERGGPGFRGILDANLADIPDIVRFEIPIFRDHEALYRFDFHEPTYAPQIAEKYQNVIGSRDGGAAIYVADGQAVGYIAWNLFHDHRIRQAVVLSVAVEPELRGTGIGRALFDHMRERVALGGAVALRAHVWAHNAGSRTFFEAHGFMPDHTVYTLPLKDAEAAQSKPN
jgi:GNAT superfamily N-acetyltransferase